MPLSSHALSMLSPVRLSAALWLLLCFTLPLTFSLPLIVKPAFLVFEMMLLWHC